MSSISGAISQMIILILIACMGFVCAKVGYIDADTRGRLTKILVNVTLPCMIVVSGNNLDASQVADLILLAFLLAIAQFALLLLCGWLCNVLLRTPPDQRSLYLFMAICTNTAFIGLPIISSMFGGETTLFASIFVMVLAFFMYSAGFAILAGKKAGEGKEGRDNVILRIAGSITDLPWKSICNPSMGSCLIAIALLLLGIKIPHVLASAMGTLGGITSPIAMMIVGSIIAEANFSSIVKEARLYPTIIFRQLIVPIALLFALRALGINESLVVVFTIMFAMPIGALAPSFAEQFGHDSMLAAKGTVLSTAAAFAIIPLVVAVMALP